MKFFTLCFFLAFSSSSLQGQQLMWFDTLNFERTDGIRGIDAQRSGHVIVMGPLGPKDRYDGSKNRMYIARYDSSGDISWFREDLSVGDGLRFTSDQYGTTHFAGWFYDLSGQVPTICGTVVPAGTYMARIDSSGNCSWFSQKQEPHSIPASVVVNPAGEIEVRSSTGGGIALHQYDSQGKLVKTDLNEQSRFCKYDSQGNSYKIFNGLLTKYDSDGHPEWIYQVGQEGMDYTGIIVDATGCSYILADNGSVIRINTSGDIEWNKTIGGTVGDCDGANLYTAGEYYENGLRMGGVVHKTNARTGEIEWSKYIPHSKYFKVMALSAAGGNVFVGAHFDNSTIHAYLLMLRDHSYQPVTPVTTGIDDNKAVGQFAIFPNPGSEVFTVTGPENCTEYSYQVIDASGKVVREITGCSGNQEINLKPNAKGIYQVRLQPVNGPAQVKKIIVE